jgi:hypothetical protein
MLYFPQSSPYRANKCFLLRCLIHFNSKRRAKREDVGPKFALFTPKSIAFRHVLLRNRLGTFYGSILIYRSLFLT